jgi:hypothetical protein
MSDLLKNLRPCLSVAMRRLSTRSEEERSWIMACQSTVELAEQLAAENDHLKAELERLKPIAELYGPMETRRARPQVGGQIWTVSKTAERKIRIVPPFGRGGVLVLSISEAREIGTELLFHTKGASDERFEEIRKMAKSFTGSVLITGCVLHGVAIDTPWGWMAVPDEDTQAEFFDSEAEALAHLRDLAGCTDGAA